ncbi:hypothetical protein [Brachyspira aalborgi]|uniref:Uncharacterized protein n=2 Tax=Brachyspira aalborgi TaxID=29522 RepID=A0AB38PW40_9SPIR|nr:hypothetical protein [Brachyspira aalborgi]TXJ23810.1 hypothetical protein EPJ73_08030 [Brachyspira aalborgi]
MIPKNTITLLSKAKQSKAKQTFKLFPNLCLLNHNKYYISFYKKLSANKNKESLPYKYISNTDINLSLNNSIKILKRSLK